jgi:hypothetical protein
MYLQAMSLDGQWGSIVLCLGCDKKFGHEKNLHAGKTNQKQTT